MSVSGQYIAFMFKGQEIREWILEPWRWDR